MSRFDPILQKSLAQRKKSGLFRQALPAHPASVIDAARMCDFRSNDYLGLSHHEALASRAALWAHEYGSGSGASRLVSGTLAAHELVESKLAALKSTQSALLFPSGFQANIGVLSALLNLSTEATGEAPSVYMDRLNHASLHLACNAAGMRQKRFRHNDVNHLQDLLKRDTSSKGLRFIVTESVFSMDGDRAPLGDLRLLADRYDAFLYIDDAHATGILGEAGCGLASAVKPDLILGTCGKAMGSMGAFIASSQTLRDWVINHCASFIYSTAIAPPILGAIDAALDLLPDLSAERENVAAMAAFLRQTIHEAGMVTGDSSTQIVPFMIGDNEAALEIAARLRKENIYATAIRPPTVPSHTARLRLALHAGLTREDVRICAEKLIDIHHDVIGTR